MAEIHKIHPRQILDSRGYPTLEVEIQLKGGAWARASVPSGASTGSREAVELRDGNEKYYRGKSVLQAVGNVREILAPLLMGKDATDQAHIDSTMIECDGTPFKSRLGANSILAVSLAVARVAACLEGVSLYRYLREKFKGYYPNKEFVLPTVLMNVINGGRHACNGLDIQEFMLVPHLVGSFAENLRAGVEIFHALKENLLKKGLSVNVGDEGGVAPELTSHREALDALMKAIESAGYRPGEDISLALDAAASEFCRDGCYRMEGKEYDAAGMIDYYSGLCDEYPLYSLEDGLSEDDHQGWQNLSQRLGKRLVLIGDDLFVTNKDILAEGIEKGEANAILIKPNQIGTLTETLETMALAMHRNYKVVISHRSGETADTFIADLAVACGCGHIKTGSASRSDRTEKYNQLLRIEEELGPDGVFRPVSRPS